MNTWGWSDAIQKIKHMMEYTDQDGNDVPLCVCCGYWRATVGDMCERCAHAHDSGG